MNQILLNHSLTPKDFVQLIKKIVLTRKPNTNLLARVIGGHMNTACSILASRLKTIHLPHSGSHVAVGSAWDAGLSAGLPIPTAYYAILATDQCGNRLPTANSCLSGHDYLANVVKMICMRHKVMTLPRSMLRKADTGPASNPAKGSRNAFIATK